MTPPKWNDVSGGHRWENRMKSGIRQEAILLNLTVASFQLLLTRNNPVCRFSSIIVVSSLVATYSKRNYLCDEWNVVFQKHTV